MSLDPWKKKVDIFLSRFVARQDLFSMRTPYTAAVTDPVTGTVTYEEKASVMPACENYGNQKLCLITQRKGGCTECDHRVFKKVSDAEVWKHISGEQEMILFMLREEGIRFGAADFDKGNTFEDSKAVRDLSMSYGIPCYIAKSTKKGYHVYWFFSDFIAAHEFTSYIRHLFEELGFYERWHANPDIGIPEVFPKQTQFADNKIGNGIKVPMMEPRMKEGRNCWVDDEGVGLPFAQQWSFFESTLMTLPGDFRQVLADRNVEILAAPASRSLATARREAGKEAGTIKAPKPYGDFGSVVEGCPAMQEYWMKDASGKFVWDTNNPNGLFHDARVASMLLAIATTNGSEELMKRWPGKTDYYIKQALNAGYTPPTCRWMQERRVCHVNKHPKCGDHCMKKNPPVEYIEGKRVVNPDNLKEDLWPEPSPIRFATDRSLTAEDVVERLGLIFKGLKEKAKTDKDKKEAPSYLPENPQARIESLWAHVYLKFDERDQEKVRAAVLSNKWMTAKEIDTLKRRIKKEKDETTDSALKAKVPNFKFSGSSFFLKPEGYERVWYDAKGVRQSEVFTNFHVQINEELVVIRASDKDDLTNDATIDDRFFSGTVVTDKSQKFPMNNIHFAEWMTSPDTFFKTLIKHTGSALRYNRSDYDKIRNCANAFSEDSLVVRRVSQQIGQHLLKSRSVYLMPSVLIDKDGVRQNDEFSIKTFEDDVSKCLDFKVIDEERLKELGKHIVEDYFACNNAVLTMTTFAHAMASTMLPQFTSAVGYKKSPVLWLAGNQGGGKSFVAEMAQNFFGNFDIVQSANGTAKGQLGLGYNFRHSLMLIDDYKKALNDPTGKEFPKLVQNAYDRNGRPALQRSGKLREKVDRIRGLLIITGEDMIESEASALSRSILIDVPFKENRAAGKKVVENRLDYCGFTPYFIQFVLNMSNEDIATMWDSYYSELHSPVMESHKSLNPGRVCENLTMNMVAFRLAMEMLAARGAIPEVQKDELCRIHFGNLLTIRATVFESVGGATGSRVFLELLKEILQNPNKCNIWNWPGYEAEYLGTGGTTQVGFYRNSEPDTVYIYPSVAHGLVSEAARRNNNHVQSIGHVARQLYDEGMMIKERVNREKGGSLAIQVRGPSKSNVRVWPLNIFALGLEPDKKISVPTKNVKETETDSQQPGLAVVSSNQKT